MSNWRTWVGPLALAWLLIGGLGPGNVLGQQQTGLDREGLERRVQDVFDLYEQQLQAVLRARLQEEQDFITKVVALVRAGVLPKEVVDRAWLWTRSHRAYTNHPFVYFERILRLQTGQLEIPLPPFDYRVYSQIRRSANGNRRPRR